MQLTKSDKILYVICIGGEDADRTYKKWGAIIHDILHKSPQNVGVMAGSQNSLDDCSSILA